MSQFNESPRKCFPASGALAAYLRVKLDTNGNLAAAGAEDQELGVTFASAAALGNPTAVHLRSAQGTIKMTSSGSISKNAIVYGDTGGKVTATQNLNPIGIALEASGGNGQIIEVLRDATALRCVGGQHATVAAVDTIVTGLSVLVSVTAGLDDSPGDDPIMVNASIGDQNGSPAAGSFLLNSWKDTGGTDPTPVAATTFSKKANWIAYGY